MNGNGTAWTILIGLIIALTLASFGYTTMTANSLESKFTQSIEKAEERIMARLERIEKKLDR